MSIDLKELTNRVTPAPDVYGAAARELEARLGAEPAVEGKVELLQAFLLRLLGRADYGDEVVRHAVRFIQERRGLVTVGELTERMGYSQRYHARCR